MTAVPTDPATALPGWMDLPDGLSAAEYEALPEDICRRIEIVDGAIIVNAAPRRLHQDICRRLANALESACRPAFAVSTDIDLRLRDIPLLNRRPDAVIYDASLPDDAVLRPQHCTLVVEVMSPGSVTVLKTISQLVRRVTIPHYSASIKTPLNKPSPCAPTGSTSHHRSAIPSAGVHTGKMTVTEPVSITIDLNTLL